MLTKVKRTARTGDMWPSMAIAIKLRNVDLEGQGFDQRDISYTDRLTDTFPAGVAFHHAGLDADDRTAVEKAFLQGNIGVICCTSTLAVGVNLPCYLVIIKNTVSWQAGGLKEYSDLETMQMLGRAGRYETFPVLIALT